MGLRRFGYPSLAGALECVTLMMAISAAAAIGSLLLAGTALPYADAALMDADRLLFFGFEWHEVIGRLRGREQLLTALSHVYATLNWQPTLLIVLLFTLGQAQRCWTLLLAWGLTLVGTMLLFPFLPALGGYLHLGIEPSDMAGIQVPAAWRHVEILGPVRDGSLRLISARTLEGVVTFPSFHAAAAVLLGWGYFGIRLLRWPFVALNVAMFGASLVIGGHYLVDLAAGGLIAVGAIYLARICCRGGAPATRP
jgi:membrane-associated phospholipid phosphatase